MPSSREPAAPRDGSAVDQAAETRERLMDAAEHLVALHSERGVSARAIIAEAGLHHNSAITYHFGDRSGLLDAVWTRGSDIVNGHRRARLDSLGDRQPGLRDLVEIWVQPFAAYLDTRHPSTWARFNEEALRYFPLAMLPALRRTVTPRPQGTSLLVLIELLEAMVVHVRESGRPHADVLVSTVVRMVISAFAAWERQQEQHRDGSTAVELGELLMDMSMDAMGAGLRSPAR